MLNMKGKLKTLAGCETNLERKETTFNLNKNVPVEPGSEFCLVDGTYLRVEQVIDTETVRVKYLGAFMISSGVISTNELITGSTINPFAMKYHNVGYLGLGPDNKHIELKSSEDRLIFKTWARTLSRAYGKLGKLSLSPGMSKEFKCFSTYLAFAKSLFKTHYFKLNGKADVLDHRLNYEIMALNSGNGICSRGTLMLVPNFVDKLTRNRFAYKGLPMGMKYLPYKNKVGFRLNVGGSFISDLCVLDTMSFQPFLEKHKLTIRSHNHERLQRAYKRYKLLPDSDEALTAALRPTVKFLDAYSALSSSQTTLFCSRLKLIIAKSCMLERKFFRGLHVPLAVKMHLVKIDFCQPHNVRISPINGRPEYKQVNFYTGHSRWRKVENVSCFDSAVKEAIKGALRCEVGYLKAMSFTLRLEREINEGVKIDVRSVCDILEKPTKIVRHSFFLRAKDINRIVEDLKDIFREQIAGRGRYKGNKNHFYRV